MTTLIEWVLVILAGSAPLTLQTNVPGAVTGHVSVSRRVMSVRAPWFIGQLNMASGAGQLNASDCSFMPYWDGQTRYPCSPYAIAFNPNEPLTIWPTGGEPGSDVVVVVVVDGFPPVAYLPLVAR